MRQAHDNLEKLVHRRTEELLQTNNALMKEIGERKSAQKLLRKAHSDLERLVKERTAELEMKTTNLEELNVALNVLLKKGDDDKKSLEKNFIHNVKSLILPYIEKLKNFNPPAVQKSYLEIIEANIHEIVSPFTKHLSSSYFNLTPTEIRVANLIKNEKTSKEIAEAFNISESAIIYHRYNIRKKLGLNNKKINLKTYLQSLQ
jgi:DNA-binding CsgD family transcriptional regulator